MLSGHVPTLVERQPVSWATLVTVLERSSFHKLATIG